MDEPTGDEWIWHGKRKRQVYAVLRVDLDSLRAEEPGEHAGEGLHGVTVTQVLPTAEEAAAEAARLNGINGDKRCAYYWMTTRYYPEGRPASGGPPSPPVPEPERDEQVAELLERTIANAAEAAENLRSAGRHTMTEQSFAHGVLTTLLDLGLITSHDFRVWSRRAIEATRPAGVTGPDDGSPASP